MGDGAIIICPSTIPTGAISRSSQLSTTFIPKAVLCAIPFGMVRVKDPLLLIGKSSPSSGGGGFPHIFPVDFSHMFDTIKR